MARLLCFLVILQVVGVSCDDGVILFRDVADTNWDDQPYFCINYNPHFHNLTTERDASTSFTLVDLSDRYGCTATDYTGAVVRGNAVIISRGNCTFSTKARMAQSLGATALVISSDELAMPAAENASVDYNEINIVVATMLNSNVIKMKLHNRSMEVLMYAPQIAGKFDPSMIVIFLIAFTNIAIGGYWAGQTKHARYERLKSKQYAKSMENVESNEHSEEEGTLKSETDDDKDNESVDMSLPALLVFFVLVCGFLVLLYFFYDELVYVLIGLFCLAGAMGLYCCIHPIWTRIFCCSEKIPRNKIPFLKNRPEYRNIVLGLVCVGVAVFWGIMRHASYAWIIQDILGYAFCINMMKTVGIPNLRVCTVLLILLFVYDVFFVFVTPYLTSSGESVMVKVATGSGSKTHEQLPMVFKVPKLTHDVINVCPLPFSLLGFGDIIIPGFLVAHNHAFDLYIGRTKLYYLSTVAAYGVGLIITFIALSLMETGQPALLYLVPCTLLTTFLIGCCRGEVKCLWAGMSQSGQAESRSESPVPQHSPSVETLNSNSSAETEDRTLLRK